MARAMLVGLAMAAVVAVGGCRDDGGPVLVAGPIPEGPPMRSEFLSACAERVPKLDCGCFWARARQPLNQANIPGVVAALAARYQWSGLIVRSRLEALSDAAGGRLMATALYACVRM